LEAEYDGFRTDEFPLDFNTDHTRLLVVRHPRSFSDNDGLDVQLLGVKWSRLQFFWRKVITPELRQGIVKTVFTSEFLLIPSSFCLHLVVLTSDERILLTQAHRSKSQRLCRHLGLLNRRTA